MAACSAARRGARPSAFLEAETFMAFTAAVGEPMSFMARCGGKAAVGFTPATALDFGSSHDVAPVDAFQ